MVSTEGIRELVEPVLASVGLELWDVEITRDVVRIMVERSGPARGRPTQLASGPVDPGHPAPSRPDGGLRPGVDLDALSDASSVLSPVLDAHPEAVPPGRYQLEVSSPGSRADPAHSRAVPALHRHRDHRQDLRAGRRGPPPPRPPRRCRTPPASTSSPTTPPRRAHSSFASTRWTGPGP